MVKEMVEILFPATKNIDEVVGIIEKYRMKFGLNTGLRLAMFLAQVREETGSELKVIRENLNYSEEALPKLYKAFNDRLADKYGRNEEHKANQEAIANIAYANRLGNGAAVQGDRATCLRSPDEVEFYYLLLPSSTALVRCALIDS